MTYTQAIEYLYGLRMFGMKLGLENTRRLAGLFNNPQERLRFIHVAGTNGKGSTCAMLESIYRNAGWRVGLFTSPHLVSFTERLQLNRRPIQPAQVVELVGRVRKAIASAPEWNDDTGVTGPTFFEVVTILGLLHFAEQGCDLVIWETGMGGRLDATNIVQPLASVITNIELDHQQWLGSSHDQIAAEKAGIIKAGVPVITAASPGRGLEVITETAHRLNAPLTVVGRDTLLAHPANHPVDAKVRVGLLGAHQRLNAAVAVATVNVLQPRVPVDAAAIEKGLATVAWPGRAQLLSGSGGQRLLLDGAHNPAGAAALADTLRTEFPQRRPTLILGMLADKDWEAVARILVPEAGRLIVVPVTSQRTLSPAVLEAAGRQINPSISTEATPSLAEALARSENDELVVITGSLYLVGEALEQLGTLPPLGSGSDERGLNEWGGVASGKPPVPPANKA